MNFSPRTVLGLAGLVGLSLLLTGPTFAQNTSISYQGLLTDTSGQPLSGTHNLTFQLFDDADPAPPEAQIGPAVSLPGVQVTNGLFTAPLDFGADAFDGSDRWLQASVDGQALVPRQQVLNAPQANYARKPWAPATGGIQYNSRVGIGTGAPAGALHVHTQGTPAAVDQQSHWNNFGSSFTGVFVWQSFTAGVTGLLTRLDIGVYNNVPQNANLRIYSGEGTGGTILLNQSVFLNNGGWMAFTLPTPVPLVAGQTYTWFFEGDYGYGYYFDRRTGSYAGGRSSVSAADDFAFETWMMTNPPGDLVVDALSGNVGIGTTSPSVKLDVAGNIKCVQLIETSSRSMKQDIRPLENALDTIDRLQGVTYKWKPELGGGQDIGFIAEDVAKVLPEVVMWEKPGEKAAGLDYGHITALAVEAIKAQQAQIEDLKRENAQMKQEMTKLRETLAGGR